MCPYPTKVRFKDELAAKMELAKIQRRDNTARPKTEKRAYRCGGHWHLTSKEKKRRRFR